MATINPILSEAEPNLEKILSRHGLKMADLGSECPLSVRNEIAVELSAGRKLDEWQMVGRCLEFSREKLRDIDRQNTSQELCGIALLDAWSKRDGPRATYLKLADVLCRRQWYGLVNLLCIKLKLTSSLVSLPGSVANREVPSGNGKQYQNSSGIACLVLRIILAFSVQLLFMVS